MEWERKLGRSFISHIQINIFENTYFPLQDPPKGTHESLPTILSPRCQWLQRCAPLGVWMREEYDLADMDPWCWCWGTNGKSMRIARLPCEIFLNKSPSSKRAHPEGKPENVIPSSGAFTAVHESLTCGHLCSLVIGMARE